jgi:tetratricopeptide (TPR) repeat protein
MKKALLLLLLLASRAHAADEDLFARANKDYSNRNYEAAIAKYEQLVKTGLRHEDLFYNLGNAYFRSAEAGQPNRLGKAILSYERALALAPAFDDARYNLDVARDVVGQRYGQDKVKDAAADPLWVRAATYLPLATLAWAFFIVDVLFFAVLIALRFLPSGFLRTGLIVLESFAGIVFLAVGVLLGAHVYYLETVRMSVVTADEVVMREGPDASRREGPKLHAGHRAEILREDHGWARLRLANKVEGWVPADTVDEI